jgi:hypothetical protein
VSPTALIVTVHGPTRSGDFAALADVPTARLAEALARALGEPGSGPWALAAEGAPGWDGGRTLAELGVGDAAVLHLLPRPGVSGARS